MEKISLVLSLIGAGAWIPQILKYCKRQKLFGKIISRYNNYNDSQTFFLFKIAFIIKNKPFNLKEVECQIKYEDGQTFSDKARNMKEVIFNRSEKLLILGKDFINNFAVLTSDKNIEGYLFFMFEHGKKETKIKETIFIFRSFENKEIQWIFDEKNIDSKQLFYDESIWSK